MSVSDTARKQGPCRRKREHPLFCAPAPDMCGFPGQVMSRPDMERVLADAGLDAAGQEHFFALCEEGRMTEAFCLLRGHRRSLLKAVHLCQKQIDCLDFLLFSLEQGRAEHQHAGA